MIYGIGIDLVDIRRMEKVISRWGDRFINRVFTRDEIQTCYKRPFPPASFALRFAAKEAFSKALGLGMRGGLRWQDIEVFHFPGGRPGIRPLGRSSEICKVEKISGYHLSLSDEGNYGVAMVILEK
ncbi:MAG: holo-ACP synthase [Deltaproteobacteria bacterium]|nr:holo-ACP synthase [Deltaproteobacteria bacterium]MBW2138952.1 holo-ACP synthase [Deltaproteobacteria bacterium]